MTNEKEKPYSFWPSEAVQHGLEKAVILYNLRFWLTVNKAAGKDKHYHDGKWWTYNTAKALENLMPFFNRRSIARWLLELESEGVLLSGMFNKVAYDRTKWYTIPSEFSDDAIGQNDQCSGQDGQSNGQDGQPIPDCNPVEKPVVNLSGTSADAPCSVCDGTLFVGAGIECHRCSGTGKEPNPDAGISGRSSATGDTDQPAPSKGTPAQGSKAVKGSAAKPKKPRTDAEKLINLVKSKPELCVCLNCLDDELLTEWAKLRVKMKASDSDRALKKIESALEELRTVHRIAPDIAIEMQCDKGWRGLEVDWVLKNLNQNRPNMSYTGNQQPAQNQRREIHVARQASELSEDQMAELKAQREALKNMTKDL